MRTLPDTEAAAGLFLRARSIAEPQLRNSSKFSCMLRRIGRTQVCVASATTPSISGPRLDITSHVPNRDIRIFDNFENTPPFPLCGIWNIVTNARTSCHV
ncbi:hypothetical protein MPTK1_2g11610 [Marchantia polymorpha subsp. ruderalis]|uniref:Uncharacterized protein n=1 Tax=Marchantia polymorpha TaxID=3197 RepID=A0A2R6XCJ0_MARPO|nr:hypothetical protein MARPO_0023s0127 [Marchantia polymorpha]BBN01962.1 hypothetical protein Mp_2g11610 [Marchantia polymorpha subsp. ruderalis]|eukprot:PTQ43824.1 hypothetical protein MARPO_0023s0127 [Marchantia polymorpha]